MKTDMIEAVFYTQGELTFEQVKEKALLFLDYIRMTGEDLSDYWYGICDNWDLNIWMDDVYGNGSNPRGDGSHLRATLYPVTNEGESTLMECITIY